MTIEKSNDKPLRGRRDLKLTPNEEMKLQTMEAKFENSFTKLMKYFINNEFDFEKNVIIKDTNNTADILKEINKIGVNINQISRYLNIQKSNIKNVSFSKIDKDLSKLVNDLTIIKRNLMQHDH